MAWSPHKAFGLDDGNTTLIMLVALGFRAVVALVNLRGIGVTGLI